MTTIPEIEAGNIVESDITCDPASGTVALADVTARILDPNGNVHDMTVTETAANIFHGEWEIPDTGPDGLCRIRWESNPPSPKIVLERDVSFYIVASKLPAP